MRPTKTENILILATNHLVLSDSLITVECQSTELIRETKPAYSVWNTGKAIKHTKYVVLKPPQQFISTNNALSIVVGTI